MLPFFARKKQKMYQFLTPFGVMENEVQKLPGRFISERMRGGLKTHEILCTSGLEAGKFGHSIPGGAKHAKSTETTIGSHCKGLQG